MELTGIVRAIAMGSAFLREVVHPAAPPRAQPLPAAEAGGGDGGWALANASLPTAFAGLSRGATQPGDDPLENAMREALAQDPGHAAPSDASVARLLAEFALPRTPAGAAASGAAWLLRDLFGHRAGQPSSCLGEPMRAQDISGSILDQSTGRFTER